MVIDRRLARDIAWHEVVTVPAAGWAGLRNGELLIRDAPEFDVFVIVAEPHFCVWRSGYFVGDRAL